MSDTPHADAGHDSEQDHDGYAHVMPWGVLVLVFLSLIGLTGATVWAAGWNLGNVDLIVAMAIATAKATLVALYFMHLRYDKPFNALLFITALVFVGLFVSLTLLDTFQYGPEMDNWPAVNE